MKKFILSISLILYMIGVQAQNRKQIAGFTQFKQFYNPSLTGYEGSVVRSLYRNQWTGFEDAPKTLLATGEIDVQMLGKRNNGYRFNGNGRDDLEVGAKHALGLTLLYDQFGPSKESQVGLSYGSGIRLSEGLRMRWGTALTYRMQRLDGSSLTVDQENDPRYTEVLGNSNRSGSMDLNIGLALTAARYYIGYGMQDVTAGSVVSTGDDFLNEMYTRKHVVQAGYRANITGQFGFTLNGIYQYDSLLKSTVEGQVKAVYQNMFWVGGGYRNDQAYNLGAGLNLDQLYIGYAYETPFQEARAINKATNEITLAYKLLSGKSKRQSEQPLLW
ncbi:hypothetical protein GCM10023188_32890 [Pontibacter saemangeumensis]|uniref:Type IX secretion system membrane protein, PorP/SprF family n=1 Tax=Pontibacter saemangeumensis TaxID=1084525 RepID=A0ABP8LXC5_9BACT